MAMPPKLEPIRVHFIGRIDAAEKLVESVRKLSAVKGAGKGSSLHVEHVGQVVELAFMGMCAQWETFLEDTMLRYVAGAVPVASNTFQLRLAKSSDLSHAFQLLSGKPSFNPESDFMSWTNGGAVIERAKVFLRGGEPYAEAITDFGEELRRAFQLRNRVAHSSQKSIKDFKQAASFYLGPGKVKQSFRVADLLKATQSKSFTKLTPVPAGATRDYFSAHAEMFRHLARKIVP